MNKKGITLTAIYEAESLNYGEGIGNVTSLKKISRNNGEIYTYNSRQAMVNNLKRKMGIDNTELGLDGSVIQFAPATTIADSAELDLFGYMKTAKPTKTRSAVVRVSNAISLESFNADLDFLTNKGMLDRYNATVKDTKDGGNISQSEIHKSFYVYTITIDLDKVGIDENDNIEISNKEKAARIEKLLDAILLLDKDIKGRRENLSPVFIIGGAYDIKTPFFENRVKLVKGTKNIDLRPIKSTLELSNEIYSNTNAALIEGIFDNNEMIKEELNTTTMKEFFNKLKEEVNKYYNE